MKRQNGILKAPGTQNAPCLKSGIVATEAQAVDPYMLAFSVKGRRRKYIAKIHIQIGQRSS